MGALVGKIILGLINVAPHLISIIVEWRKDKKKPKC